MSLYSNSMENKSDKEKETAKQWFRKFASTYPAFHFVTYYVNLVKKYTEKSPEADFARQFANILSMESNRDINDELRMVELEKDLIFLVEETDNKVFYRPLFFPSIFINNDFHFENLIIKGVYITECHTDPGTASYNLHHPNPNDYAIFIIVADIDEGCEFYANFALLDKVIGYNFLDSKEEASRMKKLAEYIRVIICNIIDMVEGNDDDLNVVTIVSTKEQNLKRIKRGQIVFPTKVYIRTKGKFKKYVSEFKREISKPSHSFPVRGHFRHFLSKRFTNVQGDIIWIKPFIKGMGIKIAKDYKIVRA